VLTTHQQHAKTKLVATIATILVIAGVVVFVDHFKAKDSTAASSLTQTTASTEPTTASPTTTDSTTEATDSSSPSTTTTANTSNYKDGTYTATSNYYVPHGNESIQVSVTLKDGVVTNSSVENSEGDHDSARYQEDFAAAYKSYVVGKKISGLQLNIISGASDTTEGFNDALSQIVSKAQA
jgi:uncharacterized protein with FMN-binding domain